MYRDNIVRICAVKVGYTYARRKRLLAFERFVEALAKLWLDTQSLEHENAHAHKALLGRIITLIDCVVEDQDDKVMGPVGIDDEGAEALVALQSLPEEHDHLRGPRERLVAAREVRGVCLKLPCVSKWEQGLHLCCIPVGSVFLSCHQPGTGNPVDGAGDRGNDERSSWVPGHCRARVWGRG